MESKTKKALEQLEKFLLVLELFKKHLEQVKGKFFSIRYYEKFVFGANPPSRIPIDTVEEFWTNLSSAQKSLLKFRKSFNENDLPEDIRQSFVDITINILQNKFDVDKGVVKIGGIGRPWWKEVSYVKNNWKTMDYDVKVIYSQEAYESIHFYFQLVNQIQELKVKLSKHFTV